MARIMLFEDDPAYIKLFEQVADMSGHEIVTIDDQHAIDNLPGALDVIHKVATGEIEPKPDVYVVDGNLRGGREGLDGKTILRTIGQLGLEGRIIGNSASRWSDFGEETQPHFDAQKDAFSLMDFIDQNN